MTFVLYYARVLLCNFTTFFTLGEDHDFDVDNFLSNFPEKQHDFMQVCSLAHLLAISLPLTPPSSPFPRCSSPPIYSTT